MHTTTRTFPRFAAALGLFAAFAAQAADTSACNFAHPAVARNASCATAAGVDANTFIVQPPASTRWLALADGQAAHANYAHPAVAVARMQPSAGVDANTFIVQPPVTVSWTVITPAPVYAAVPAPAAR